MNDPSSSFALPPDPVGDDPYEDEILPTKWPTVVGTISIVIAGFGLLCGLGGGVWLVFSDAVLSAAMSTDVVAPTAIKAVGIAGSIVMVILGVVLLLGGTGLVRRRRKSVGTLRTWAFLRIVWLLASLGLNLWILPANIEYQLAIQDAQIKQAEADGREFPEQFKRTEDSMWAVTVISTAIATAVTAIYPTFIIFYLSRAKIADEIRRWP